ncbi:MAG: TonB-dependent receptor domain-containing protein [Adhaeribacter sp.]
MLFCYSPVSALTLINKKKLLLTALLCCFSCCCIFAQLPAKKNSNNKTVKGTVQDSTGRFVLSSVTVVVREVETNGIVNNFITKEDGSFEITALPPKQYQLLFSFVGYKAKIITLPIATSPTVNLGVITLTATATQLQEAQVLTQKLLVEQDADKLTYNVEADPESNLLNSLDMLRKVPMLTVDADDNLQINGNNNYQILLNGKRSSFFSHNPSELLKSLPASTIKKIEVITNPSAAYEAAGVGGIINIITQKSSISGYNGAANVSVKSPKGLALGGYLTATIGKFGFSNHYNHNANNSPVNRSIFFREDRIWQNRLEQTGKSNSNSQSWNTSSALSYELTPQNLITASFNYNKSNGHNGNVQEVKQRNVSGALIEAYQNLNLGDNSARGSDFNLNYQHSSRKTGQQRLSLSFNLINSPNKSTANFTLQPVLNYTQRESTTQSIDETREYTAQADYVQPIGKQTLEVGIKTSVEQNSSNYFYQTLQPETGILLLDSSQSNNFGYRLHIHAAYASLNLRQGSWGLRTGARLEAAKLNADFTSSNTRATPQYRNLFPNITLSRLLKGGSTLKLSYSQRIQRPGLYYLNPYVDQTDPLNISYGNPALNPATSHIFQLDYNIFVKNASFNASVFHNFTNNSIQQFTTLGTDSVARTTYGNLGQDQNFGLSLSTNTTLFRKLSLNLNSSTQYVIYTSLIEGKTQRNEGFNYNFQSSASYRFGKTWRASGSLGYNSPNVLLQGRTSSYTLSSLSVNKEFLKSRKASIALAVRSPHRKYRRAVSEINNATFYQQREAYSVIRQFNLAFNYRFSKLQGK